MPIALQCDISVYTGKFHITYTTPVGHRYKMVSIHYERTVIFEKLQDPYLSKLLFLIQYLRSGRSKLYILHRKDLVKFCQP